MATYELPDDLADYLEKPAKKKGQKPQDLLVKMVYDHRDQHPGVRDIKNIAPKNYLGLGRKK